MLIISYQDVVFHYQLVGSQSAGVYRIRHNLGTSSIRSIRRSFFRQCEEIEIDGLRRRASKGKTHIVAIIDTSSLPSNQS